MPIEYIPYTPQPVEGQAVLNNVTRTRRLLTYRGADGAERRIARGLPLYDVDVMERVNNPEPFSAEAGNILVAGSCLATCAYLKDRGVLVDLVYIDPPFASGADYAKKIYLRRNPKAAEDLQQAEAELDDDALAAFEETMYGDIWTKEAYLDWMYENLHAIKSVMSETGSIYMHLDWHLVHYVKILMDEVFGEANFQREIIWDIQVLSGFKTLAQNWIRGHDTILYYSMGEDRTFNKLRQPHSEEYLASFTQTDDDGRAYMVAHGTKRYRDEVEAKGKPYGDVWGDIMSFQQQPTSAEKVDYPTQKPESLLERIIAASSDEGMLVADFFGGSGTTARAAHALGRRFVTADVGVNSLQTSRDSLRDAGAAFEVAEVRDGVALFRNPAQTMDRLAELIPGLAKGGVPAPWFGQITDPALGPVPVHLPNLVDTNSRVLDVPGLNRLLTVLPDLDDATQKVIVYYVDVDDLNALQEWEQESNPTQIEVELRDLKEVLSEAVMEDHVEASVEEVDGAFVVTVEAFVSDRLIQAIEAFNQKKDLPRQASLYDGTDQDEKEKAFREAGGLTLSDEGLEGVEAVFVDAANAEGAWHTDAEVRIDKKGYVILNGEQTKDFWDGTVTVDKKPLRLKVRSILGDETVVPLG